MNIWQKLFLLIGIIAASLLLIFPPQFVPGGRVRFLLITDGHPIDWLQLFMWLVAVVFVTGLGIAINKQEHK